MLLLPGSLLGKGGSGAVLDLNFLGGALDSRVTFSRGSTGSRYNASGLLETVASGLPRFDYDPVALAPLGLLVEESRTNLALQSNAFGTTWTLDANAAVAGTAGTSPDGSNDAWKLTESTTTSGTHFVKQTLTKAASALPYSFTIFAKAAERSFLILQLDDGSNGVNQTFNLSTGAIGSGGAFGTPFTSLSASMQSVSNGWYRCTFNATSSAATTLRLLAEPAITDGTGTYAGTIGSGILIYGTDLEQAAFPTSYIPTTTAAVTRAADVATVATSSFAYNAQAGSWALQATMGQGWNPATGVFLGSVNTSPAFLFAGSPSIFDGVHTLSPSNSFSANAAFKAAMSYANGGQSIVLGGSTVATSVNSFTPAITSIDIGAGNGAGSIGQAWFQRVRYYNRRLPDATLQGLTA